MLVISVASHVESGPRSQLGKPEGCSMLMLMGVMEGQSGLAVGMLALPAVLYSSAHPVPPSVHHIFDSCMLEHLTLE